MPACRLNPPPALVLCSLCLAAAVGHAAEPALSDAERIEALERRLGALQTRVERLEAERRQVVPGDPGPAVEPAPGGWRVGANWRLLSRGMAGHEVEAILGPPDRRKTVSKFEFWEYADGKARFYLRRLKSWEVPGGIE